MKRFIPLIGDTVLAAVCAFLLFFTLVRYYSGSAAGLAAGICGAMAAGGAAFAYISIKQKKSSDSAAESSGAVKLFTHLSLLESGEAAELFRRHERRFMRRTRKDGQKEVFCMPQRSASMRRICAVRRR